MFQMKFDRFWKQTIRSKIQFDQAEEGLFDQEDQTHSLFFERFDWIAAQHGNSDKQLPND